jgi:hypothetical protein
VEDSERKRKHKGKTEVKRVKYRQKGQKYEGKKGLHGLTIDISRAVVGEGIWFLDQYRMYNMIPCIV